MSFKTFIAWRYLRGAQGSENGRGFLRFVSWVAIGGVALGVATLLLALSIVRGFSQEIETKIVGFGAHVQIESIRHNPLADATSLMNQISEQDAVVSIQPVVTEFVLLRRSSRDIDGVGLWGTDRLPVYLEEHLASGSAHLEQDAAITAPLVIGNALAESLGLTLGDQVTILSTRNLRDANALLMTRPRFKQFEITGIYETALADFDETYVFTDIDVARQLLDYGPEEVTRFDLMLQDVTTAESIALTLEETLGLGILARSIFEIYRGLFAWVDLQEAIIPLVISVLILVAAFNVMGALLMIVLEKTREIGILASMGTSRQDIQKLYLHLGFFVGGLGTAIGLVLAWGLGMLQLHYGIVGLPAEAYYMTTAPVAMYVSDFAIVAMVSLLLCLGASYFPARVASRILPLQVIRFG
ncbi:MAG: ABC transporter permease [Bacteroidota bacterium]|nr:ABC transporter permease [Bacteroidota bacterium]